jgi:hypothetical protein
MRCTSKPCTGIAMRSAAICWLASSELENRSCTTFSLHAAEPLSSGFASNEGPPPWYKLPASKNASVVGSRWCDEDVSMD